MDSFQLDRLSKPDSRSLAYIATCLAGLVVYYVLLRPKTTRFPFLASASTPWSRLAAKRNYLQNARQLLAEGASRFTGPFNILTDSGTMLMLPPNLIDAVNAEDALSFREYNRKTNLESYETFKSMRPIPEGMAEEAIIHGITRALPKFTKPLSLEMNACLVDTWGESSDWRPICLNDEIHSWVGRLSTRIFLGEEFTRNGEWLRITAAYTRDIFTSLNVTRFFPRLLRPLVDLVSPLNRRTRSEYQAAKAILQPEFARRDAEIATAARENREPVLPDDSIEWFRNASHGRSYNQLDIQLALSFVAIHTTTDLLCQALLNLCSYPEYVEPLRREAVEVLQKHGLQKLALTELRLLDSFLKETQRLKPVMMAVMHRKAVADVELSGGIKIRRGEHTAISASRMWDEGEYTNAERFQPWRFTERRRIPGHENKSLLVATSPEHLGFAHGKHACPGRFFAANEVKIAMLHILMKYDMRIEDKADAVPKTYGQYMMVNPEARVWIKRRTAEVDLEALAEKL